LPGEVDQLLQRKGLIISQVNTVKQPSYMPVGGVDEPHGILPRSHDRKGALHL
jgi:hypothetical protein